MYNFKYKTPEECGVPSHSVKDYLKLLEDAELSTHGIIIARGNNILFEKYYPPFNADFLHRQYSVTKSIVSLAVGFAFDDRLIDLNSPISKYFPNECKDIPDARMGEQTVREMLCMSVPKKHINWFKERSDDRVSDYFIKTRVDDSCGKKFFYDSTASFILCAAVERVTGKDFISYLRQKLFDKIGVSNGVKCLLCPGGHSWGDSGMLARPLDMLKITRFLLDCGKVNGNQLLSKEYINQALSLQTETKEEEEHESFGYGYGIWLTYENSFFFNGMGNQIALAVPSKDIILIINSDNQGIPHSGKTVIKGFFDIVYPAIRDSLCENRSDFSALCSYADNLKLACVKGAKFSPTAEIINKVKFNLKENKMKIDYIRLTFKRDEGILNYKNAQGEKSLSFGLLKNIFSPFPEEGYSKAIGSVPSPGNYYKSAASGGWQSENEFLISVQITDDYFGRLWMRFVFDGDRIKIKMNKSAEDFLDEYKGEAEGLAER